MKRRGDGQGQVPDRLWTFTAADWPGADEAEAFAHWSAARGRHAREHGWPGGEAAMVGASIAVAAGLADEPWSP